MFSLRSLIILRPQYLLPATIRYQSFKLLLQQFDNVIYGQPQAFCENIFIFTESDNGLDSVDISSSIRVAIFMSRQPKYKATIKLRQKSFD